jgi:hypothetical protein
MVRDVTLTYVVRRLPNGDEVLAGPFTSHTELTAASAEAREAGGDVAELAVYDRALELRVLVDD